MARWASGKHSRAICDKCGFEVSYRSLKKEWTGIMACPQCWDPKHPALNPVRNLSDPEAIRDPRGESDTGATSFPTAVDTNYPNSTFINSLTATTQLSEVVDMTFGLATLT